MADPVAGPRRRPRVPYALVPALAGLLAVSTACSSDTGSTTAPAPKFAHDAPTLLAAGTGNLEGSPSMRLSMKITDPGGGGRPVSKLDMSGVWDLRQQSGRMDGTLRGAKATVLSIGGTEYVSLPADLRKQTGRQWLKGMPGTDTFREFPDPHRIAMILRTVDKPKLVSSTDGQWQVHGTVLREAALKKIPDPTLQGFVAMLPAKTDFDLWTDNAGKPQRIVLTMPKESKKFQGTVVLSEFGATPTVRQPTVDQVLTKLPAQQPKKAKD